MNKSGIVLGVLVCSACYEGPELGHREVGPAGRDGAGASRLGVHFAYDSGDVGHEDVLEMFDGRPGYTVELVYAVGEDPAKRRTELRSIADAGFEVILRVDYRGGVNIPPDDAIDDYVDFIVDDLVEPLGDAVQIFVVGNEPNLTVECTAGMEAAQYCDPSHYAEVYGRVRQAVHERNPNARVLVAGMSPGGVEGVRWKASDAYWQEVLAALGGETDGFAVHAYGGGEPAAAIDMFERDLDAQLDLLPDKPIYITELNRKIVGDEPKSAAFLVGAYGVVDGLDDRVRTACWFIYGNSQNHAAYSLRGHKSADGTPQTDVWHAFRAVARGETGNPAMHPVHRAYSHAATDHFYTSDLDEITAAGYTLEHENYFYLRDADDADTVALWRCWSASESDHFYTTSPTCEDAQDMVAEGRIGYLADRPLAGTVPLHRLYKRGDHFYTISSDEADSAVESYGYAFESIVGYVWTGP